MKIIVERDVIAKALSAASRLLPTKPTIPILGNLLLQVGQDRLSIKANNLDMQLTVSVPCEVDGDGPPAITIPGDIVTRTVNGLATGAQLSFEWQDERTVTLRAGSHSRYKLHALPACDFPDLTPPGDLVTFTMSTKDLALGLESTEFAMGHTVDRLYLCGVLMHIANPEGHAGLGGHAGKRLIFIATDTCELGFVPFAVPDGAEDMPPVIIPDKAVKEILKLAKDADTEATISVSKNAVIVVIGSTTIHTRLIDGDFPGYMRHIPGDGYREMIVDVAEMEAALTRLLGIGEGNRTTLKLNGSNLTLGLVSQESGEAEENVHVDWQYEELKKRVNAGGILSCLKHFKTDLCAVRFHEPAKPILLNEFSGEKIATHRTFLSMPMEGS